MPWGIGIIGLQETQGELYGFRKSDYHFETFELGGYSNNQFRDLAVARGILRRSIPLRLSLPLLLSGM